MRGLLAEQRFAVQNAAKTLRSPRDLIAHQRLILDSLSGKADNAARARMQHERHRFSLLCGKLDTLSPLRVLRRGYTIAEKDGAALDTVRAVHVSDTLTVRFADGAALCEVQQVQEA